MTPRGTHAGVWLAAALLAMALPAGCGGAATAGGGGSSAPSTATSPRPMPVAEVARRYLLARDQAVLAGTSAGRPADYLRPGSPAALAEPYVALGRVLVEAQTGGQYVAAATQVVLGPPAFSKGAEPVAVAVATRAVLVASVVTRLTAADATEHMRATQHTLTLVNAGHRWAVYEDDYIDPQQPEQLAAAGAPPMAGTERAAAPGRLCAGWPRQHHARRRRARFRRAARRAPLPGCGILSRRRLRRHGARHGRHAAEYPFRERPAVRPPVGSAGSVESHPQSRPAAGSLERGRQRALRHA